MMNIRNSRACRVKDCLNKRRPSYTFCEEHLKDMAASMAKIDNDEGIIRRGAAHEIKKDDKP